MAKPCCKATSQETCGRVGVIGGALCGVGTGLGTARGIPVGNPQRLQVRYILHKDNIKKIKDSRHCYEPLNFLIKIARQIEKGLIILKINFKKE